MYASKRRQRNFKRVRDTTNRANEPSNPSKRHRERLNGELETVAGLLPYDEHIIQRLDKLSVLRLAVSFLQIKAHFQVCSHISLLNGGQCPHHPFATSYLESSTSINMVPSLLNHQMPLVDPQEPTFSLLAQKALGGFVIILNQNAEIYYVTENIETYLGFLQSDVLHQSLYEMIHSEDRESLRQNLLLSDSSDYCDHTHRNVVARFRCLLDNTCGFIRVEIKGRLMVLHSTQSTSSYVNLNQQPNSQHFALVAVCTPFVPPLQMDPNMDDPILKTKHSLDLSLSSIDNRLKTLLEIDETTPSASSSSITSITSSSLRSLNQSFYSLIHPEDVKLVEEAHDAVIKYCSSGLMIYRLIGRVKGTIHYVQSSLRLFFKNGKPETIGGNHRLLTEVDGNALLEKRASLKFKYVSFDDTLLQSPRIFHPQIQQKMPIQSIESNSLLTSNIIDCKPSTSGYKMEAPYYLNEQKFHGQHYNVNCNLNANVQAFPLSVTHSSNAGDKKSKYKYHTNQMAYNVKHQNITTAHNDNVMPNCKKKIVKQLTKRINSKKTNAIKLAAVAAVVAPSQAVRTSTLSLSSSSVLAQASNTHPILNQSYLNNSINLNENVSSAFTRQMLPPSNQHAIPANVINFPTSSVSSTILKDWKAPFLYSNPVPQTSTNSLAQIESSISNNKLALPLSNDRLIEHAQAGNFYGNFVNSPHNNVTPHHQPFMQPLLLPSSVAFELPNGTDLLMNTDYLDHYYQYYYPTTNNYTTAHKIAHYSLNSNDTCQDYCYTNRNALLAGSHEYINEGAGTLTELLDVSASNTNISKQLAMARLISNGYPVPTTVPIPVLSFPSLPSNSTSRLENYEVGNNAFTLNTANQIDFDPRVSVIAKDKASESVYINLPLSTSNILTPNSLHDNYQYPHNEKTILTFLK